jgi:hypothetical protein
MLKTSSNSFIEQKYGEIIMTVKKKRNLTTEQFLVKVDSVFAVKDGHVFINRAFVKNAANTQAAR